MKVIEHIQSDNYSNVFLYIAFMIANIDYVSIVDYSIKALLGALIWYGVKLLHDRYLIKMKKKMKEQTKKKVDEDKTKE